LVSKTSDTVIESVSDHSLIIAWLFQIATKKGMRMITKHKGNILDNTSGIIVHGVNAQGVMGSGIAKQIRDKYPAAYRTYKHHEELVGLNLGSYSSTGIIEHPDLFIVNMVTQEYYGKDGMKYVSYDAIHDGFTKLFSSLSGTGFDELPVRFPAIGAGLGGGNLDVILAIIQSCDPMDKFNKELWVL